MTRPITLFLTLFIAIMAGNFAYGQSLSRTVVSSGGDAVTTDKYIFAYNIGEPVADLLVNTSAGKALTTGFIQGDADDTKIAEIAISPQLALYPNPVRTGTVQLDFRDIPDGRYVVDIIDAVGHVLFSQIAVYTHDNHVTFGLNVSNFKGGTYYVRVKNGKAQGQVKLIKL